MQKDLSRLFRCPEIRSLGQITASLNIFGSDPHIHPPRDVILVEEREGHGMRQIGGELHRIEIGEGLEGAVGLEAIGVCRPGAAVRDDVDGVIIQLLGIKSVL